jgi:hypothetical protein
MPVPNYIEHQWEDGEFPEPDPKPSAEWQRKLDELAKAIWGSGTVEPGILTKDVGDD